MILARVIGEVVSTQKEANLQGLKLLLCQAVDPKGQAKGGVVVAADAVGAGIGELVLYAAGSSARQTQATKDRPVDSVVMAIVDTIHMKGERTYDKESDPN